MTLASERHTVQKPFVRYAQEVGWAYLSPEEALRLRGGEASPILRTILVERLQRLNPGVVDSATKAEEEVERLIRVRPDIEGNLQTWEYLRGLKTTHVEAERRDKNLRLLDLESLEANAFHVTEEFSFKLGPTRIRADIVFLINGIPVLIVEAKAATRAEGIAEALEQIRRYHQQGPELMALAQLYALTDLSQFYYGPTWNLSSKALLKWRQDQASDFETLVKTFVAPRRLLKVLTDYILFVRKDGELSKVVLRPHQMRAVEKVIARAADPEKRRGLIWHTQGSGKTFTMITVAKHLLEDPRFENPTVLMIVDRNELQQQLFQNLEAVGVGRVQLAYSKEHLRQLLRENVRGLLVSMIHKFGEADPALNTRKNIFVLIDEAHRTTGGDLGNYLMGALPDATFIGFTGTPIDKTSQGKGTFKIFGGGDAGGYLDKYSIRESVEDGTTVPLLYQIAPNELVIDRETMEREFWKEAALEGVSDIETLDRVLDRAVTLRNMLKNPDRVEAVARFVAEHFRERIQPMGYKAFLVAVDREACCLYKAALDRYLAPEVSQVVMSRGQNDPPLLRRYHLSDEEEAEVRKAFRRPDENPQIFIVTDKLLTGYDAPILLCMYLDKPMRDHVLLQAIARVNRPYEDEKGRRKTNGLIVDFVGIFEKLNQALAFDSREVEGVVEGIEVLQAYFSRLMAEAQKTYLPLLQDKDQDKAVEAVLEHFRDKERREAFYRFFSELEETYETLSPDPFLRPYMEEYLALVKLYTLVRNSYQPSALIDKAFLRKTAEIVRKHTSIRDLAAPTNIYQLGASGLLELLHENKPDTVKVFNLLQAVHQLVATRRKEEPYLIPIGERAEAIRKAFEERQMEAQEALAEMRHLLQNLQKAEETSKGSGLSQEAQAVRWWLQVQKKLEDEHAEILASEIAPAFEAFPHWVSIKNQESQLRGRLQAAFIRAKVASAREAVAWVDEVLALIQRAKYE